MKDDAQSGGKPETKNPQKDKDGYPNPAFKRFKNLLGRLDFDANNSKLKDSDEKKDSKSESKPKSKSKSKPKPKSESKPKPKSKAEQEVKADELHEFHLKDQIINWKVTKFIQEEKDRIIKFTAAIIGVIFILLGFIMITTAAMRVVDNVMFGERAMLSSFLILIGVLIIFAVFWRRFWQSKVFKKLNLGLEDTERIDGYKSSDKKPQKSNIENEHKK
ncbi:MAG TPA: DUF308 domain-containing protein [Methanobacteriaceae archaeon]|nr:DUF308 domain-containing protein [Methanobacteriaceae archaeon]